LKFIFPFLIRKFPCHSGASEQACILHPVFYAGQVDQGCELDEQLSLRDLFGGEKGTAHAEPFLEVAEGLLDKELAAVELKGGHCVHGLGGEQGEEAGQAFLFGRNILREGGGEVVPAGGPPVHDHLDLGAAEDILLRQKTFDRLHAGDVPGHLLLSCCCETEALGP